ncbi:Glutathione transport system permease protein GsiD [bacterium HR26]|nr:Glutathione transport system permease protein GsiD [bacterium HR26]
MAQTETHRTITQVTAPRARRFRLSSITPSSRYYWLRLLLENPAAVLSIGFIGLIVVLALLAPWIAPYEPTFVNPAERLRPPSREHWFGTDDLGRDVFSRAVYGARISLVVGLAVMVGSMLLGSLIGLIAGYYARIDTLLMRVMDGLEAFPSILLAIAIMATLGSALENVIIALSVVYAPNIARLVRSTTLMNKRQPYVESARAIGLRDSVILRRYIFLNSLSPLIVQCTFVVAFAILAESSLSYLGAGVPPGIPTWGNMVSDGQAQLQRAWWIAVFPGMFLFLTVLTVNLLGDGLRDALDPRVRRR